MFTSTWVTARLKGSDCWPITILGLKSIPRLSALRIGWQRGVPVTPAEVAQQLMKSDDPQVSLDGLVEFFSNETHTIQIGGFIGFSFIRSRLEQ
ncbi:unnamed protein product [Linum trigynum]|uniref:AAA+ ATPase At3g28540-like C-terminal domain-containing protein n=1 Tax=Linum trigynum TaxID=586398 RepID=A0AAV2GEQ3_9ROSI